MNALALARVPPRPARGVAFVAAWLLLAAPAHAQFVITEFMAANSANLNDEDGDNTDWIEIHNESTTSNDLAGWFLTDRTNDLDQWEFPTTPLPPNGYLVVFASNKNRRTPGAPLHTNFRLDADGEYLALVRPDRTNVASEFFPLFPPQVDDVSYGLAANTAPVLLIDAGAPVRALVPSNPSLGLDWTLVEFDDTSWTNGTTGVGYDRQTIGVNFLPLLGLNVEALMYNLNPTLYLRLPFTLPNPAELETLTLRLKFEDGFIAYLNGQEVARSNAPPSATWNSAATTPRTDTAATNFVDFDLGDFRGFLMVGVNVLAVHALNNPVNSPDLLLVPQLVGATSQGSPLPRYFPVPTPGQVNAAGVETLGPIVSEPLHVPLIPNDGDTLAVTARIRPTLAPLSSAVLRYRVMFGPEVGVPLLDDGAHGDGAVGDGVYGAAIPAGASIPGQMVRWYFTATDTTGTNTFRLPLFQYTNECPAYFGTVIANPTLTNPLPVFHWFVQDTAAADTFGGTRASVFYNGEFYDNVFVRLRGATAATYPKKPYKFDFNPGYHFRYAPGLPRVDEVNLNSTYQDKALIRPVLTFETYQQAGVPACDSFPVRLERNGTFFSVAIFVEQVDETFLERRALDPHGALYKMFNGLNSATSGVEKKTRRTEDNSDLQQLVDALALNNPRRGTNLFDLLDLPEVINYLAAGVVAQDWDRVIKNIYVYRDTENTRLWQMYPWDKDLTFGKTALLNDTVTAVKDGTTGASGEPYVSHPYYGQLGRNCCGVNNLFDAVYATPATRLMFLRRLRTLMDQSLQPPGTPGPQLHYEARVDAWYPLLRADAALDLARWGAGYGQLQDLATALSALKTGYLAPRRTHLYQTHSLAAASTNAAAVGIPPAQTGTPLLQFGVIEFNPASANQAWEFVELFNPNPVAVDLSGWRLEGGVRFTFAPGTVILSGSRLYVSPDVVAFKERTTGPRGGQGLLAVGNYRGQLSARGETLHLVDAAGLPAGSTTYQGAPSPAQRWLRITELMYHPPPPAAGTNNAEDFEYVELKNVGPAILDLSGVHFTNGIEFAFAGGALTQLEPAQSVVVVKNLAAFIARYGTGLPVAGQYAGNLDNAGERVVLLDASNEEVLDFTYDNRWYPVTDGLGFSLVIADETLPPEAWDQKESWRPSGEPEGSPGAPDTPPPWIAPVLVNEVLSHTDPPAVDAIELHNPTTNTVDVGGWFVTDDVTAPGKFRIPSPTELSPGGFVVFTETDFNPAPGLPPSFAFSSDSDEAYLFSADPAGRLTGYAHGFRFGAAAPGVSFGRHITSIGAEHFVAQSSLSLGTTNAGPKVGPVVVTEIMYHPPGADGVENTRLAFIELQNLGASPAPLFDPLFPTNTWRLRTAVEYDWPAGIVLPPGVTLLLVGFDPIADPTALAQFRATYALGPNTAILGPYAGRLDNAGERLELQLPGEPLPSGDVPYVLADAVDYRPTTPWPPAADGDGSSLQRLPLDAYGDDPASWFAAGRTPGASNVFNSPPAVRILAPTNNSSFSQPATIPILAEANDTDGAVARVEFFADGTRLGEAITSPFSFTWVQAPSGTHALLARAIDQQEASAWSEPVTITVVALPPTVALVSPRQGEVRVDGAPIVLAAAAGDSDGVIANVEFFDGLIKLGETAGFPYTLEWTNAAVGVHTLKAVATDNAGLSATSEPVSVVVAPGFEAVVTLLPSGSTWKYFDAGLDLGTAWRAPQFDDRLWSSGPAELGYGDAGEGRPEATVVGFGPNPAAKYITTYFRQAFAVTNASAFTGLNLHVLRDDGAVVYLNGNEVFRTGMAEGPVLFGTLANVVVAGSDETVFYAAPLDPAQLVEGTNVLAVEVHQRSADSSDLSFDLALDGMQTFVAPFIVTQPASAILPEGANATLSVTAVGTAPLHFQWQFNGSSLAGATGAILALPNLQTASSGAYSVVITNSLGSVTSAIATLRVYLAGNYAQTILADRPIHFYRFNETNGTTIADAGIPGAKPGRLNGGVTLGQPSASPILGAATGFNGAPGTYVDLGLFHPGNSVTIEAWVNLDPAANNNPSYNAIVARWDGSYELDLAPGDLANLVVRNQVNDLGLVGSPFPLTRGQWCHLVGIYDSGVLALYVDGVRVASAPFPGTLRNGGPVPDRVLIGATRDGSNSSFQWRGLIDEVALYDYGLSEPQIQAHYLAALPPPMLLSLTPSGRLSWPNYDPAFRLQETPALRPPQWTTAPYLPTSIGSLFQLDLPMTEPQRFYRLIKP